MSKWTIVCIILALAVLFMLGLAVGIEVEASDAPPAIKAVSKALVTLESKKNWSWRLRMFRHLRNVQWKTRGCRKASLHANEAMFQFRMNPKKLQPIRTQLYLARQASWTCRDANNDNRSHRR